ncbi:MAG: hypothetical protein AAFW46_07650 [Pseudomonadota bacterium]
MGARKTAIVVLHGIGQQEQLRTLRDFSATLTEAEGVAPPEEYTRRELRGEAEPLTYLVTKSRSRDAKGRDEETVISEFYWADLSQLASGMFSSLRNLFILQSNLPDIALASFDPRLVDGAPRDAFLLRLMRTIITFAMWLIYVPIFALNAAYAAVVGLIGIRVNLAEAFPALAYVDAPTGEKTSFIQAPIDDGVYGVIALAALMFAAIAKALPFRHAKIVSYWSIGLLILLGVYIAAGEMVMVPEWPTHKAAADAIRTLFTYLWFAPIAILAAYLVSLPALWLAFRDRWRSITLSFFSLFVAMLFWLLFFVIVWLSIFNQIFDERTFAELLGPLQEALPTFSANLIALLTLSLLMLWTALVHHIRSNRARRSPAATRWRFPRLILPSVAVVISLIAGLAWFTATIECRSDESRLADAPRAYLSGDAFRTQLDGVCDGAQEMTNAILTNTVLFLVVVGFIGSYSTSGVDTATDIVNYFKSDRGHRKAWLFRSLPSVWRTPQPDDFEVRVKQRARLSRVIDDMIAQSGPFDRTVLVSHSLGAMVAIDFLKREAGSRAQHLGELTLVTMGSPYANIFNFYFPHLFPPVTKDLIPGLKRWVNIFRENDYVGTRLTPKDGDAVEEVPQPARGHLGYFSDLDVAKEISWRALERRDG